ncbi:MAG: corrinoid protein [Oscillospiraceae bacterium]|nr:corrinoid protein [Oscillospiraceae bacterium]
MELLKEMGEFLTQGKASQVQELVAKALEEGISPNRILDEGMLIAMNEIGDKFKEGTVFIPEVLVAARAMNKGVEILRPALVEEGLQSKGTAVIGTAKGDLHDIGKNLVRLMMECKGITVVDLGVDVSAEKFLEAARENNAGIIACSALLTTTMVEMQRIVDLLNESDLKGKVKVLIGGAPVTDNFCRQIGADGYAADATSASEMALTFV